MNLNNGYAVVDLEMSSGDPAHDLIIEFAVGLALPGENLSIDRVLVSIDRPLKKTVSRLTGISDRDLAAAGIGINDALAWFAERTRALPLVGHSILHSDRPFLIEAARKHRADVDSGLCPRIVIDENDDLAPERFIDTQALYKGYMLGEYPRKGERHHDYADRIRPMKAYGVQLGLQSACKELRIPTGRVRTHRAAGDVLLNHKIFEKLLELNPPG